MGYHTDFTGEFRCTPTLSHAHADYLRQFSRTRRMKRDPQIAATLPDPLREAVGLPIGDAGAYFVGGTGLMGQDTDPSVTDHNTPPGQLSYGSAAIENAIDERQRRIDAGECQPGLWCQWIPSDDGTGIGWDEGEKFYEYVAWIRYLIAHFLAPWGYVLHGEVQWAGEDLDDRGTIFVQDNRVEAVEMAAVPPVWYAPPDAEFRGRPVEEQVSEYRQFLLEVGVPCDDDAIASPVVEFLLPADHRFRAWRMQRA